MPLRVSCPIVELLAWPVAERHCSADGWTWVGGQRSHPLLLFPEPASELTQLRLLQSLPKRLPAPALAIVRAAGDHAWDVLAPSLNEDGALRLTRLRVPDGTAPQLLRGLKPQLVARAFDPAPLRRTALRALLAARDATPTVPPDAGSDARALAEALESLFPAPRRGWAAAALRDFPVTLREDTPEQVELAITPHVLERVYEALAWPQNGHRKDQGSWHTPTRLVYHMARESIAAFLDEGGCLDDLRVVDPSVGPGSFLVAIATLLLDDRLDVGRLERALHGVDTSRLALGVCRARVALLAQSRALPGPTLDLREGNSLVDDHRFAWRRDFGTVFEGRHGFDLAIGNPPYLRDSRKKDMPVDLPQRYRSATSHYDLYALFMERSLQMVRPGGRICLLTSNRYLAQKYGRGIRELLLEHALESVVDLDFKTFDAGVTTCITTARKAAPEPTVMLARVNPGEPLPTRHDGPRTDRARLLELPGSPFRVDLQQPHEALARRLQDGATTFRELGFVSLGLVFHDPGDPGRRKSHYLSREAGGRFTTPLVDGEHVRRWCFDGRLWLDYRPDQHREPRFPELFHSAKLICRRIIGRSRIMACPDDSGLYFSDNTVGFVPWHSLAACSARVVARQCSPERVTRSLAFDLHFLAALLNSRLMTWYFRTLLGFGVHFYPAHLKQLPVRSAPATLQAELAALAREALDTRTDLAAIDRDIDARVERLYELTPREAALLQE